MKRPEALPRNLKPLGLRTVWLFVMFDLPTQSEAQKRAYTRYRKALLNDGFAMMQYSVYYRHCASTELAEVHIRRMSEDIPSEGEVRFLTITDKQFGKMQIVQGKSRVDPPAAPVQLEFF